MVPDESLHPIQVLAKVTAAHKELLLPLFRGKKKGRRGSQSKREREREIERGEWGGEGGWQMSAIQN